MDKSSQEVVRLRIGEAHQGWVRARCRGGEAMLEKDDRKETVTLPTPGDTAGAITAVGAPPNAPPVPGAPIPKNGRRTNRR